MYEERFEYLDTILNIRCDRDIGDLVRPFIVEKRQELESYILKDPNFQTSFEPVDVDNSAPEIVRIMAKASEKAGVGPMAAVAGTVSELIVNEAIENNIEWIIVENGGDICLYGDHEFTISIYAGKSPLSEKIGFSINPGRNSYGICSSSGFVGHSISLGKSDSVTVFAKETPIADSFATAIANMVDEIEAGLSFARAFIGRHIDGVVIVRGEKIAKVGRIPELVKLCK
jgi:hypothetical protein